jgi:hypothetical protein
MFHLLIYKYYIISNMPATLSNIGILRTSSSKVQYFFDIRVIKRETFYVTGMLVFYILVTKIPGRVLRNFQVIQDGSNMTGTDYTLFTHKSVPVIFEPPCIFFLSAFTVTRVHSFCKGNDDQGTSSGVKRGRRIELINLPF